MSVDFFQTRMGQKFYEHDVPKLIKALERIADALEKQEEDEPEPEEEHKHKGFWDDLDKKWTKLIKAKGRRK